jgi:hypothetical protein
MVEPLRDEFALRSTLQRRKIRKPFDVDDITKKRLSKSSAGLVLSRYSPERQLFRVMYEADYAKKDLDFYELSQVLVMGKKWGDPPEGEGYTRAEYAETETTSADVRGSGRSKLCARESN